MPPLEWGAYCFENVSQYVGLPHIVQGMHLSQERFVQKPQTWHIDSPWWVDNNYNWYLGQLVKGQFCSNMFEKRYAIKVVIFAREFF